MKDDYAQLYGDLQDWHWWFLGRQRVLEAVLRHELNGDVRGRRILSVGCGPVQGLRWLLPFAGEGGRVVGLDAEPLHAKSPPDGVEFFVGALENPPFADASFDAVLALDVLEHLDDDAAGLHSALRLVRPGGLLLITVPALPSLWGGQDVVSHHRRRYTRRTLDRLFQTTGLSGYRISFFNTLLFPPTAAVRWTRRAMGQSNRPQSDFDGQRPGLMNDILAEVFAFERYFVNHLPLPIGVSLLATYTRKGNEGLV